MPMGFLSFNKSDRRALIVVLAIATIAIVVIWTADSERQAESSTPPSSDMSNTKVAQRRSYPPYYQGELPRAELFPFDPNTADSSQLLRLGLRPWQVRNIYKYRAAGGVYHKATDFARLYGLTRKRFLELKPYIRIDEGFRSASESENQLYAYNPIESRDTLLYPIKIQPQDRVVLNTADTFQLKKVPGIGSHFARRVVEYRQRLGGFYSVKQLMDIEDFPETAVSYFIIPDNNSVRKINVNRLSIGELKRHPYINFHQARTITDYIRTHGPLESLDDLKLSRDFPPEAIERLKPYVVF